MQTPTIFLSFLFLLLFTSFHLTLSEEKTTSTSPKPTSSKPYSEPKTPGASNVLSSSGHAPCSVVTSGQMDPGKDNLLTFITYCGKTKSIGRVYPLYNYSIKSPEASSPSPDKDKSTLLKQIPAAVQTGRGLISALGWTSLEKVGKDSIVTSALIFTNGSSNSSSLAAKVNEASTTPAPGPSNADYLLYVVTSDWRETKFTSFVDLGHADYFEMTPFLWDGAILVSGCPLRCYYGILSPPKSSDGKPSTKPMTLASYEFRYQNPDGEFPPIVDLTDANVINRTSPLFIICLEKGDQLVLIADSSSCSSGSTAADWAQLSTGMRFRGAFYLFSGAANRVYAFSEEAFTKPGTRVPLSTTSLKTFFGEVDDDDKKSTTKAGGNGSSTPLAGVSGLATVYWVVIGLVILLLLVALAVAAYFFATGGGKKQKKQSQLKSGKDSQQLKKSGESKGPPPQLRKTSSRDLKQKRTSRMSMLGGKGKRPSTVATSKASSTASSPGVPAPPRTSSVPSKLGRQASSQAAPAPPRTSSVPSKLGRQASSQAAPSSSAVKSKLGPGGAPKRAPSKLVSKAVAPSTAEAAKGPANLKKASQMQHKM